VANGFSGETKNRFARRGLTVGQMMRYEEIAQMVQALPPGNPSFDGFARKLAEQAVPALIAEVHALSEEVACLRAELAAANGLDIVGRELPRTMVRPIVIELPVRRNGVPSLELQTLLSALNVGEAQTMMARNRIVLWLNNARGTCPLDDIAYIVRRVEDKIIVGRTSGSMSVAERQRLTDVVVVVTKWLEKQREAAEA